MNDLISRAEAIELKPEFLNPNVNRETKEQTAIDRAYARGWNSCNTRWIKEIIEDLPSAQPELRWIPCSERLPEDYQDVLVWFEYYRYGSYNRMYSTHGIGTYSKKYDSWMINHESGWKNLRVIAWMPLPEPYKGGQDADNY